MKHAMLLLAAALAPQAVQAAQAQPARDRTGVYQRYAPTPAPTPVAAARKPSATVVTFHKPSWAVALKGGLGLPLGETADVTGGGGAGGLDVYFRATSSLSMDLFGLFMAAPYKDASATKPLSLMGGGVRALYHPVKMEKMLPHIGAGLGYMAASRATAVPQLDPSTGLAKKDPVTGDIINDVVYESGGGIVFSGAVGATYQFVDRIGLQIELSIYSVSLAGGTSDSILAALAGAGLQYSF